MGDIPEDAYIKALLHDFEHELNNIEGSRPIHSIFIGGGTPSLFSAKSYQELLDGLQRQVTFADDIEITLEANPGTYEHDRFKNYLDVGINRLSLGVQSFQDDKLVRLGRIHCADDARKAIKEMVSGGFNNINIDLMHGLPGQTATDALYDLQQAIDLDPVHISWYQLTIEPNTVFYSKTPVLPQDDLLWEIEEAGQSLLAAAGFNQYEISAYSKINRTSRHNLNYWQFGDYIGIGAGAHGKLTSCSKGLIYRNWKTRMPADYLAADAYISHSFEAGRRILNAKELPIEFMMNALRLCDGVVADLYVQRTGQCLSSISPQLTLGYQKGMLEPVLSEQDRLKPTPKGILFLNDLLAIFDSIDHE